MNKPITALAGILVMILTGCTLFSSGVAENDRISTKQLQGMLGRSDVIVIDVRSGSDWNNSESKIKGAVRESLGAISGWIDKYPRDKTFVFYCA